MNEPMTRSLATIWCSPYVYQFDNGFESWDGTCYWLFDVFDVFDVEVFIFQNNMRVEVVKMIKYFLQILKVYD